MKRSPRDRNAERACLGGQLHPVPALDIDPDAYWWPVHAAIQRALNDLDDLGPFNAGYEHWLELAPILPPSSVRLRCAAVWTMVDERIAGRVRLENLWALAQCADAMPARAAATVVDRANDRSRILAIEEELATLSECA